MRVQWWVIVCGLLFSRSMCLCTVCQFTRWLCNPRFHLLCFAGITTFMPLFWERDIKYQQKCTKWFTTNSKLFSRSNILRCLSEPEPPTYVREWLLLWDWAVVWQLPVPPFPQSRLPITLSGFPWLSCLSLSPWQGTEKFSVHTLSRRFLVSQFLNACSPLKLSSS